MTDTNKTSTTEETPAGNRRLAKVAVPCSEDTFVVNQSLVLRINICGKKSPPSPSAKTLEVILKGRHTNKNDTFRIN